MTIITNPVIKELDWYFRTKAAGKPAKIGLWKGEILAFTPSKRQIIRDAFLSITHLDRKEKATLIEQIDTHCSEKNLLEHRHYPSLDKGCRGLEMLRIAFGKNSRSGKKIEPIIGRMKERYDKLQEQTLHKFKEKNKRLNPPLKPLTKQQLESIASQFDAILEDLDKIAR